MITADIIKRKEDCIIERRTYSADISATGKPLTMYEVYCEGSDDILEAFTSLQEAETFLDSWSKVINYLDWLDDVLLLYLFTDRSKVNQAAMNIIRSGYKLDRLEESKKLIEVLPIPV